MWRIAWGLAVWGLVVSAPPVHAQGGKDTLSVDLPGEPATLDPHVQWDTDSYHVYRNIFDNLVTRNPDGKIVPADRQGLALRERHRAGPGHPHRREVPRRDAAHGR